MLCRGGKAKAGILLLLTVAAGAFWYVQNKDKIGQDKRLTKKDFSDKK